MSDEESNMRPSRGASSKRDTGGDENVGGGEIAMDTSPGEAYVIFIEMNNLSNKLKLLNYEDEYLIRWKMKPLSK